MKYLCLGYHEERIFTDLSHQARAAIIGEILDYERHLFQERTLTSVTANTRGDGRELLEIAARHHLRVSVTPYPLDRADAALADLAGDRVNGAAVLVM